MCFEFGDGLNRYAVYENLKFQYITMYYSLKQLYIEKSLLQIANIFDTFH